MKIIFLSVVFVFFSNSVYSNENVNFYGMIICELSASFVIFDFNNNIAIRNNYYGSRFKLSNYETKKSKFKKTIHTFSWHDLNDNFLGYWIMSNDLSKIKEIKFDKDGNIFIVNRACSKTENNNNKIGELIWE